MCMYVKHDDGDNRGVCLCASSVFGIVVAAPCFFSANKEKNNIYT